MKKELPTTVQRLRAAQKEASRLREHVAKLAADLEQNRVHKDQAEAASERARRNHEQRREAVERLHETAVVGAGSIGNVGTAKLIEVIEITSHEGEGETLNPYRIVRTFWSKDGVLLATDDTWKRDHLAKVAEATEPKGLEGPIEGRHWTVETNDDRVDGQYNLAFKVTPQMRDELEKWQRANRQDAHDKAAKVMLPKPRRRKK